MSGTLYLNICFNLKYNQIASEANQLFTILCMMENYQVF